MKRIAIIGGGISGLSAAFALEAQRRSGVPVDYVLFESGSRFGGVLVTEHAEGCVIETGPDSFLTEKPWATDLCRKIGLGSQLIGSNDAQRKTYILVKGKLVVMPDGLMFMVPTKILPTVFSSLFSLSTKLRMAGEWFHPPRKAERDESVAAMVKRHYGSEMVDRLADPLLSGVYGGTADQLSVRAVLPRFADMESKYGSLGRAMLAARRKMANAPASRPLFTSLKDGMQQMVDAVVAQLARTSLLTSAPVTGLTLRNDAWTVSAEPRSHHFDAIILALPAGSAADLLGSVNPKLASELGEISYSSSVTVNLVYDAQVRSTLPPGFGFLVPRSEGKRLLAATFVHNKFPQRAPEDRALIRCFLGGATDEQVLEFSEPEVIDIVRKEIREILGLTADPIFVRVSKWKKAMAQYQVGHLERLERIERLCQGMPTLALAGNAYRGIGVPDCVRSGRETASRLLNSVGLKTAPTEDRVSQTT